MRTAPSSVESLPVRFQDFRMDFTTEVLNVDDATRVVTMLFTPNEDLYERVETEDGVMYLDRYRDLFIPEAVMNDAMVNQAPGLPGYHLAPRIEDAGGYADVRRIAAGKILSGADMPKVEPSPKMHEDVNLEDTTLLVFVSVDIVGSTALKAKNSDAYDKAHSFFIDEIATLVGQFNGDILKTTGDGLIAVIQHPSATRIADNAVDMAISIVTHTEGAVAPALIETGLPPFQIRVGADLGWARQKQVGSATTGYTAKEVESHALNRAVKIQGIASPMSPLLGEDLRNYCHVGWLMRTAHSGQSIVLGNSDKYGLYEFSR